MTWTVEHIPAGDNCFLHTAAAGHGTAWAFGISAVGGARFDTLVFRRESDGWRRVDVPVIGRANRAVVLSPDELWVVGDGTSLHCRGDEWREVPVARPDDRSVQLFGLAVFGADMWTAGFAPDRNRSGARGSVQRWDGSAWRDQRMPDVAPVWSLAGIGGVEPDDLWAVGAVHEQLGPPLALHWDGREWISVPVPLPGKGNGTLTDVLALASDDVWAAGYWRRADVHGRLPFAAQWDGAAWSVGRLPEGAGQIQELVATKDRVHGVGYADRQPYLVAWDGDEWCTEPAPPTHATLHGGAVLPDGRLLVVGAEDGSTFAAVQEL